MKINVFIFSTKDNSCIFSGKRSTTIVLSTITSRAEVAPGVVLLGETEHGQIFPKITEVRGDAR